MMTKGITALGLDRDLWFSRGNQGYWPHDDDDKNKKQSDVVDTFFVREMQQNEVLMGSKILKHFL